MNQVRYYELWPHLKTLLSSARMLRILQGGKVYLEGEDYSHPEGPLDKPWGRLVLVPTNNLWPDQPGVGYTRHVGFLARAEVHSNGDAGFNPQITLDGIQDEVYTLLNGYVVPQLKYVMGVFPIWLNRPSQALPMWDDDRGLAFTSAEYRLEVTVPVPVVSVGITPTTLALSV